MTKLTFPLAALLLATPAAAQDAPEVGSLAWHNMQQAALAEAAATRGWTRLQDGVMFRRTAGDGSGPSPSVSDEITIHYTGSFVDGEVFDSSVARGEPATFPLSRLIEGWQIAIPQMGVGDTAEIVIPATSAYGLEGRGPIPGGATLKFTIELFGIPSRDIGA
ncbi:FKBP-type peptidyl-prolyl cis-trans isomerase [Aurantiacibacter aquimixticola]|uniref:Peptidyl-prolyl cis-trans isomerase n=1 Tax=Aurantiacibacter aquimixticola TaxID=1958945 RepID=A0A419RQY3_9SPHN|nr:FKBP-type peptidyl-prolyl cis-trans isomerase [Aurantiacibacter aquimixticola]RJY08180.1 FKBP-type peptidyl-prolyl cis-trans isomerase [Aurantiacibacter aquimixticola]